MPFIVYGPITNYDPRYVYVTPYSFTINSITWRSTTISPSTTGNLITGNGAVYGNAITNNTTYDIYAFGNTNVQGSSANNYTINYTTTQPTYIYALAVGGGGGGGFYVGTGGGAGGVVMMPIYIPANTNQTITVSVGAGGNGTIWSGSIATRQATNGVSSTITFSDTSVTPNNVTALYGNFGATIKLGGNGTGQFQACGYGGASSAGANNYGSVWFVNDPSGVGGGVYPSNNSYYNFGNYGGSAPSGVLAGGGGAGGTYPATSVTDCSGGSGIKCILPGIKDFSSNIYPTAFGNFYWGGGGGGGGGANAGIGGSGGIGGGGGGNSSQYNFQKTAGPGGGGGLYSNNAASTNGGDGAPCTGGGGGAVYAGNFNSKAGDGGSGIVVLAIPRTQQSSFLIQNYNFALPELAGNTYSLNASIPSWTTTGTPYYIVDAYGTSPSTIWDASYACPYVQFFYTSSTSAVTLSQTVNLAARQYTMTFCAAVNSAYTSGQFTISVGGSTVYTSSLASKNRAWNVYSFNFTPSAGSNTIQFSFSCSVGITQILLF